MRVGPKMFKRVTLPPSNALLTFGGSWFEPFSLGLLKGPPVWGVLWVIDVFRLEI